MEIIGNVSILKKHLEDQGLEVVLDKQTIGQEADLNEYNFIFIGSGTFTKQKRRIRKIHR